MSKATTGLPASRRRRAEQGVRQTPCGIAWGKAPLPTSSSGGGSSSISIVMLVCKSLHRESRICAGGCGWSVAREAAELTEQRGWAGSGAGDVVFAQVCSAEFRLSRVLSLRGMGPVP